MERRPRLSTRPARRGARQRARTWSPSSPRPPAPGVPNGPPIAQIAQRPSRKIQATGTLKNLGNILNHLFAPYDESFPTLSRELPALWLLPSSERAITCQIKCAQLRDTTDTPKRTSCVSVPRQSPNLYYNLCRAFVDLQPVFWAQKTTTVKAGLN